MNTSTLRTSRVLLVGRHDRLQAAGGLLTGQSWAVQQAAEPAEALRCLREDPSIDLVLLLPDPPIESWTELCRSIKLDRRSSLVKVFALLGEDQGGLLADLLDAGADDCVGCDAEPREILLRLLKAIQVKHETDSFEDSAAVIRSLANAIEGKDHYTCGHVERVGDYAIRIGQRIGLDAASLAALRTGGIVHDIGKVGIPDHILNKPGRLTDHEMAIMRRHPVIGYDILKPLRTFHDVLPIVRCHHEKPSGNGYPDGLKGDQIPLLARIIAVADVFDALSTDRPYHPGFSLDRCCAILKDSVDRQDLDPLLVQVMLDILDGPQILPGPAALFARRPGRPSNVVTAVAGS